MGTGNRLRRRKDHNVTADFAIHKTAGLPAELTFTSEDVALIKQQLLPKGTDGELRILIAAASNWGLDPFKNEICGYPTWDDDAKRFAYRPYPTLSGLRTLAERTGLMEGRTKIEWSADGEKWVDGWVSDDPPALARCGIYRRGWRDPVQFVARFKSFAKHKRDGSLMATWRVMPEHMLGKVAEMQALRAAFPNELSRFARVSIDGSYVVDADLPLAEIEILEPERTVSPEQIAQNYRDLFNMEPPENVTQRHMADTAAGCINESTGEILAPTPEPMVDEVSEAQAALFGADKMPTHDDPIWQILAHSYDIALETARTYNSEYPEKPIQVTVPVNFGVNIGATRAQIQAAIKHYQQLERKARERMSTR